MIQKLFPASGRLGKRSAVFPPQFNFIFIQNLGSSFVRLLPIHINDSGHNNRFGFIPARNQASAEPILCLNVFSSCHHPIDSSTQAASICGVHPNSSKISSTDACAKNRLGTARTKIYLDIHFAKEDFQSFERLTLVLLLLLQKNTFLFKNIGSNSSQ